MDQEAGDEEDEGVAVVDEDQLVGFEAKVGGQWDKNGDIIASHVNFDLSENLSETEGEENDFYIDDSEPADLEGLMVVYDDEETMLQYKHKDKLQTGQTWNFCITFFH